MKQKPLKHIHNLNDLWAAAVSRKSVVIPNARFCTKPLPAAFVINLQGNLLKALFDNGMFVYQPEKKAKP